MVNQCLRVLAFLTLPCPWALAGAPLHLSAAQLQAAKYQVWRAAAAQTLAERADASSLAAAAALSFVNWSNKPKDDFEMTDSAAPDLAIRASELEPQNAAIGWLRLQICARTPNCPIRDAATNMRWVDADNGAAWMATLALAHRDQDSVEVERILTGMARGVRFELYSNRIVVLLFDAFRGARSALPHGYLPSDAARLAEALGVAGALIIPPFTPLINACRAAGAAERHALCLKLSKVMQRSDTLVAQMIGFGIERRLGLPDGRELRTIGERRRTLQWRAAAARQFDEPLLAWLKNARARARVAQMRALPREEDVCIAILREHGEALEPPVIHR